MSNLHIKPRPFDQLVRNLRTLFKIWDYRLDQADKAYCLRRIRDKEPELFWKIAKEEDQ